MIALNFSILDNSVTSFLFIDETDYRNNPSNPLLQVKFPSLSKIYDCIIRPCEVNIINSKLLCYSTSVCDLPDGLYEFSYSIEPNEYVVKTIKHMRMSKAKEKLKELLMQDIDKDTIAKYYKLDMLIQASESLAQDNPDKAIEYYDMITKELNKLDC